MKKVSKELKFIRGFSRESVNDICKMYNIDRSNLINNKLNEEKVLLVYNELIMRLTTMIGEISKEEVTSSSIGDNNG